MSFYIPFYVSYIPCAAEVGAANVARTSAIGLPWQSLAASVARIGLPGISGQYEAHLNNYQVFPAGAQVLLSVQADVAP